MSLLLEALKKAELAKQQSAAQGHEADTTLPLPSRTALGDEPAPIFVSGEPLDLNLTTRDQLPDAENPIAFHPEDFHTGEPGTSELDLRLDDTSPLDPSRTLPPSLIVGATGLESPAEIGMPLGAASSASPRAEQKESPRAIAKPWADNPRDDRTTARQVFEAKQMDYNPRRPFYITVGALALVAIGAVGYFVWELQPRSSFATAQPVPPAAPAPITAPTATRPTVPPPIAAAPIAAPAPTISLPPTPVPPPPPPIAAGIPAPSAIPAAPTAVPAAPTRTPSTTTARRDRPVRITPTAPTVTEEARPITPARAATPSAGIARSESAPISVRRRPATIDPSVERAYAEFQRGDLDAARRGYQQALATDPLNRDALLGLAAIDMRTQNFETAEARYAKILEIDPRDPHATAALMTLRGGADPLQSESRLKNLIAQQPESASLQFSLGNQLASQSRWDDAQQAYFKAYAAEPDNADFAVNLAISLDQLRQRKLALEYYERALKLAETRPANFDRGVINARVKELRR